MSSKYKRKGYEDEGYIHSEAIKLGIERARLFGTKSGTVYGKGKLKKIEDLLPEGFERVYRLFKNSQITGDEAGKMFGVSRQNFYKWINRYEMEYPDKIIGKSYQRIYSNHNKSL